MDRQNPKPCLTLETVKSVSSRLLRSGLIKAKESGLTFFPALLQHVF